MVCEAHNTLWCGRNERECEIPKREGEYIIGIVSDTLKNCGIKQHYSVKRKMRIIGLHLYLIYIYTYIHMYLYIILESGSLLELRYFLYRCTVHFAVYLSNTPTNAHI